jgi:LacI family transcriptional regulator
LAAFKRYARKHGFEDAPALYETGALTLHGGYDACKRLWNAGRKRPTAIVTFSDTGGVGALQFLNEQGIRVPHEVSLASFDGTVMSEFTYPKLTTVSTPMYEVGKEAFELVSGAVEGKYSSPQDLLLPVRLLIRDSAAPLELKQYTA